MRVQQTYIYTLLGRQVKNRLRKSVYIYKISQRLFRRLKSPFPNKKSTLSEFFHHATSYGNIRTPHLLQKLYLFTGQRKRRVIPAYKVCSQNVARICVIGVSTQQHAIKVPFQERDQTGYYARQNVGHCSVSLFFVRIRYEYK